MAGCRYSISSKTAVLIALIASALSSDAAELSIKTHLCSGEVDRPSFILNDLDNNAHQLEDYRGRVVLVNFWASWCAPCVAEMPSLQRLATRMSDKSFRLLTINSHESRPRIKEFLRRYRLDFTVLLDRNEKTRTDWCANLLPTSVLIDKHGNVRYFAQGEIDWDDQKIRNVVELMAGESLN